MCKIKNLGLRIRAEVQAEVQEEMVVKDQEVQGVQQVKTCRYALRPRRIRTAQRLPKATSGSQRSCLFSEMNLTTYFFSRFLDHVFRGVL